MYRKEDITLHSSSSSTSRDGEIVFNVGNDIEEQPPEKPGVASIFYPVLKFLPEDVSKKFLNASKRCLIASIVGFAAVIVLVVSLSVTLSNQNGSTSSSSLGLNLNSTTFSPKDEPETNIGFVPPSPTRVPSISPNDEPDITIGFKPLDIARPTEANNVSATSSESSVRPTQTPAAKPASQKPSQKPVVFPKTDFPTAAPTVEPTETPTINLLVASNMETIDNDNQQSGSSNTEDINTHVTYMPGNLSTHMEHGLLLSQGLGVRLIAQSGQTVDYADGSQSEEFFHFRPDAGMTGVRHNIDCY